MAVTFTDTDLARIDQAIEQSQMYGKTRAGFVRNATLRAIEALEATGNAALPSRGVAKPGASVARNGSKSRGRK